STVTVFLGLRESPQSLGFAGENHWYFDGYDHDRLRDRRPETLEGNPPMALGSFPSLKDPEASSHTAEIITFLPAGLFDAWREQPWRRRGEDYDLLKARIARGLIDLVERHHPGFRDLVVFEEVSTPLTIEQFSGHPAGQIYGIPSTPARLREGLVPAKTDLPGLLLTGADVCAPGVAGALMGGVFAAAAAMGPTGYARIMREVRALDPS
ncbi:MAG: all-trans-retinol 13,14-reductase, partial [Nocardioides sp.]